LFEGGFKVFDEHREVVELFEAFVSEPENARLASSFYCEKTPRPRNMKID
jgi:hypothetical protein